MRARLSVRVRVRVRVRRGPWWRAHHNITARNEVAGSAPHAALDRGEHRHGARADLVQQPHEGVVAAQRLVERA